MKQKSTILFLAVIPFGLIVYAIIWYLKKQNNGSNPVVDPLNQNVIIQPITRSETIENTENTTVDPVNKNLMVVSIPGMNPFTIDLSKTGGGSLTNAAFPLQNGSRGIEVLVVQKQLNAYSKSKGLVIANIVENGTWDASTTARFNLIFPYLSLPLSKDAYQKLF